MVIIWRGIGLAVPILLVLSGWITSYWFEDTRLGNGYYMGWTMFWASLPLGLMALGMRSRNQDDQDLEPGEVYEKQKHDFFWIPMWVWASGFLIGGLYFVLMGPSDPSPEEIINTRKETELTGEIEVRFWNPTADSMNMVTKTADADELYMDEPILPGNVRYLTYDAGQYRFQYGNVNQKITVKGGEYDEEIGYQKDWYVMDASIDLVLLDVTKACVDSINVEETEAIDWKSQVIDRYEGGGLMKVRIKNNGIYEVYTMISPQFDLPLSHDENEGVYTLVPIENGKEPTEEYLDSMIVDVCF